MLLRDYLARVYPQDQLSPLQAQLAYTRLPQGARQYHHVASRLAALPVGSTACVLCPNNLGLWAMGHQLHSKGIAFQVVGAQPLAQTSVPASVLAFLRLAKNPGDAAALKVIYKNLQCHISYKAVDKLLQCPKDNVFDALCATNRFSDKDRDRLLYLKNVFAKIATQPSDKALESILLKLDFLESLTAHQNANYISEAYSADIAALMAIAQAAQPGQSLTQQLEETEQMMVDNRQPGPSIVITDLTTAPQVEPEHLYVLDLHNGVLPTVEAIEDMLLGTTDRLWREGGLLWQAIASAKKSVELIYASRVETLRLSPSRFIANGEAPMPTPKTVALPPHALISLHKGVQVLHVRHGIGQITLVDWQRETMEIAFVKVGMKSLPIQSVNSANIIKIL